MKTRGRRPALLYLRASLFALGLGLSTLLYTPVALGSVVLPFRMRFRIMRSWNRFNLWWLRRTCGLSWEVQGLEHVPKTAAVVLAKHQSAWETLALQLYFEPLVWVLKRELLRIPFFGWGLAAMRPIAIDRGSRKSAMQRVIDEGTVRLHEGISVVIFPEGTRTAPGKRGRYRVGGAMLAQRSGHPIVPVAHNAGDFWPRRSFLKYPGTIRLVFGPAIEPGGREPTELIREVETWIEGTMVRLRGPGAGPPVNR